MTDSQDLGSTQCFDSVDRVDKADNDIQGGNLSVPVITHTAMVDNGQHVELHGSTLTAVIDVPDEESAQPRRKRLRGKQPPPAPYDTMVVTRAREQQAPDVPQSGDIIMILKRNYLDLILAGNKVLEIRHCRWTPCKVYLGCKSFIYGTAYLQEAIYIETPEEFQKLHSQHCVHGNKLPYAKHNWAIPLSEVSKIDPPVPYCHPRGAQTRLKYRPVASAKAVI